MSTLPPVPALFAPEFLRLVARVVNERGKLELCDGRLGNGKGFHLNRMNPFFVVEDKRLVGLCPKDEQPSRNLRIAFEWTSLAE